MVLTTYTIYKLYKEGCPDFYIGSTFDIKRRQSVHKYNCNNPNSKCHNLPVYQFIRDNGGYDSWSYEVLQQFDNDIKVKDELHYIERAYIDLLKPSLNRQLPTRTTKEWVKDNKETVKEYFKQYRQDNKEKYKQYSKQSYENGKERHKQYYQDNKERLKQKINCECGSIYTRGNTARHFKTTKHQNYINLI